ncbi:MAG: DNA replication protein DnaD [Candidatus Nealsonbacteria bacterium]|nr:MAG: DNA replication protein DnaD [Candidatus Nealsonbacteria bacterium]
MNKQCKKLIGVRPEGNITPVSWYKHIKTEKGSVDHVAITLLADIFYWYRPTEQRNEQTGEITGYKQKFKADKLQKSYEAYAGLFGFSKRQIKRAFDNLVRLKLITREFRNIKTDEGLAINNVMYVEINAENIFELTYGKAAHVKAICSRCKSDLPQDVPCPATECKTNTETTTEITTKKNLFSENSVEYSLSKLLFSLIQQNNPKAKKPDLQSWCRHIDLAIRIDKRTPEELEEVIKWCQTDVFWSANILSTAKLRKQFDQLWLKMNNGSAEKEIPLTWEEIEIYKDGKHWLDDYGEESFQQYCKRNGVDAEEVRKWIDKHLRRA